LKYLLIVIKLPISLLLLFTSFAFPLGEHTFQYFIKRLPTIFWNVASSLYDVFKQKLFCKLDETVVPVRGMTVRKVAKDTKRDRFTKQKQYLKSFWRHQLECKPKNKTKKDIPNLEHSQYINLSKQSFFNYLLALKLLSFDLWLKIFHLF